MNIRWGVGAGVDGLGLLDGVWVSGVCGRLLDGVCKGVCEGVWKTLGVWFGLLGVVKLEGVRILEGVCILGS